MIKILANIEIEESFFNFMKHIYNSPVLLHGVSSQHGMGTFHWLAEISLGSWHSLTFWLSSGLPIMKVGESLLQPSDGGSPDFPSPLHGLGSRVRLHFFHGLGWSILVLVKKCSVFLGCHLPSPLAREKRFFLSPFLSVPLGILGLMASSALILGYVSWEENSGTLHCFSLGPEFPRQLAFFPSLSRIFLGLLYI